MKFTKKLIMKTAWLAIIGLVVTIAGVCAYENRQGYLEFDESSAKLDELSVWADPMTNTSIIDVLGSGAVPGAEIKILLNGEASEILVGDLISESFIDEDGGDFIVRLKLPIENGIYMITAQQTIRYKELKKVGSFSAGVDVLLDSEAPKGTITLRTAPPDKTNKMTVSVLPIIKTNDESAELRVLNGGSIISHEETERGLIEINLNPGLNHLSLVLEDEVGNQSTSLYDMTISFDEIAPHVAAMNAYSCPFSRNQKEVVCLDVGQFYGPLHGTAYAPVTGLVRGDLEYVTFNGRRLSVKADGIINQRVAVYVTPGDNIYDIEASDQFGNVGYGTLSVSWSEEEDDSYNSGPTALCNDGTYSYSKNRSGTCSWHGGVDVWY